MSQTDVVWNFNNWEISPTSTQNTHFFAVVLFVEKKSNSIPSHALYVLTWDSLWSLTAYILKHTLIDSSIIPPTKFIHNNIISYHILFNTL